MCEYLSAQKRFDGLKWIRIVSTYYKNTKTIVISLGIKFFFYYDYLNIC